MSKFFPLKVDLFSEGGPNQFYTVAYYGGVSIPLKISMECIDVMIRGGEDGEGVSYDSVPISRHLFYILTQMSYGRAFIQAPDTTFYPMILNHG